MIQSKTIYSRKVGRAQNQQQSGGCASENLRDREPSTPFHCNRTRKRMKNRGNSAGKPKKTTPKLMWHPRTASAGARTGAVEESEEVAVQAEPSLLRLILEQDASLEGDDEGVQRHPNALRGNGTQRTDGLGGNPRMDRTLEKRERSCRRSNPKAVANPTAERTKASRYGCKIEERTDKMFDASDVTILPHRTRRLDCEGDGSSNPWTESATHRHLKAKVMPLCLFHHRNYSRINK